MIRCFIRDSAIVLLLLFHVLTGYAQNGKIISKEKVSLQTESFWENITQDSILKPNYRYLEELSFYEIYYWSDSIKVKGYIIEPNKKGVYPVVIFNRGGNRNFSPLTLGTLVNYTSQLAAEGYVIIASNYREKDEFGGNEINDVLVLTETIQEIPKADTSRIGMFGWSRGGMMTYLALAKTDKIKTAIVGNGPTDLFAVITDRPEMETNVFAACIPDYSNTKEAALKKRSVVYWADSLNKASSLLILSGTHDQHVNPKQAEKLVEQLDLIGYNYTSKVFETNHFFSDKKEELNETIINWFYTNLKNPCP
jgi:dipeptidyl aminopeptidase/acylaminoacyl peptidase